MKILALMKTTATTPKSPNVKQNGDVPCFPVDLTSIEFDGNVNLTVYDDIPPQMKKMNIIILILMTFKL